MKIHDKVKITYRHFPNDFGKMGVIKELEGIAETNNLEIYRIELEDGRFVTYNLTWLELIEEAEMVEQAQPVKSDIEEPSKPLNYMQQVAKIVGKKIKITKVDQKYTVSVDEVNDKSVVSAFSLRQISGCCGVLFPIMRK